MISPAKEHYPRKNRSSLPASYFQKRNQIFTGGRLFQKSCHDTGIFLKGSIGPSSEFIFLPTENADGHIGAHLGTLGTSDTFFLTKQNCSRLGSFVLRHLQIQEHSRTGSRTETTALAPGPIDFDPGKHNKLL